MNSLLEAIQQRTKDRDIKVYGRILEDNERDARLDQEESKARENAERYRMEKHVKSFMATVPPRYRESTFDNFEGFEETVELLKSGKSAVLFGGNGTGKTHLGYASCRYFSEKGWSSALVLAYKFFNDIKLSFAEDSTEQVLERYASYDYLVIDEIDKAYGSQNEFVHLYHLVNERYNFMRPTVLITNAKEADLIKQVGVSVLDRIASEGAIIEMKGENYRQKERT